MKKWQIWIDTGGTFTDCIAQNPQGNIERRKVLSSGRLRAEIRQAGQRYFLNQRWSFQGSILVGYTLYMCSEPDLPRAKVLAFDPQSGELHLDTVLNLSTGPQTCDFSAGEEAPILGIRLLTQTALHEALPAIELRLGFTKGTNALLERKGAKVALLITKGFADLPWIGTQQRLDLFQLNIPDPQVLYEHVFEVNERLSAQGEVLEGLTGSELEQLILAVKNSKVDAVAVALLHSYRYPEHELALGAALQKAGIRFVSLSHQLSPGIKLLSRAQTALVDAYLAPILDAYLRNIQIALAQNGGSLRIMSSAGGLVSFEQFRAKDSLLSGPAGGIVGAADIARQMGFQGVLTLDMGGTSTDTARYDGAFDYRFYTKIDDLDLQIPALSIETVAAGGGSICYFDGQKLCVGPESAGAKPGPACYGAGGPLCISDVNLLLGKMSPAAMNIPIDLSAARQRLQEIQAQIQGQTGQFYPEEALLKGFESIADEKMAEAIRRISVARGFNPADYALLAFGGAGGMHACKIADLLGIQQVIVPYDGGLLSAYGIGQAAVERLAAVSVLQKWEEAKTQLPKLLEQLTMQAFNDLEKEGFGSAEMGIRQVLLYLRFVGQESSLEVPLSLDESEPESQWGQVEANFHQKYQALFGYVPKNRALEWESIRVLAAGQAQRAAYQIPLASRASNEEKTTHLRWKDLALGQKFNGPLVLYNDYGTSYLPANWALEIHATGNALLRKKSSSTIPSESQGEAIELELFSNRFTAIAEEMGAQLQRTAFSVNVKERLDFSCAVLDAEGNLLVNAPHIPVHLGSLGICTRLVKAKIEIGPGDVVIVNHPKYGGSHLPDVTLISGVFNAQKECLAYLVNRAHHAEIGGKKPGSMPPDATCLEEEGVAFLPTYLVKNGVAQWEAIETQLITAKYPTRALAENLADLHAALAALYSGEAAFLTLVEKHSEAKVRYYMQALQKQAKDTLKTALQPWLNQTLNAEECLDDGRKIALEIVLTPDQLKIDFRGSGEPHPHNLNANISIIYSAVIYVLRLICGQKMALNDGLMSQVEIILPDNSFLHPQFADDPAQCPAVVGGNTEISQRVVDTLLKAFGLAACSQGTMNNFLFGDATFGYYETIGGGAGAGPNFKGRSAVHQHMTNTRITDPEDLELRYPVRLWRFAIRQGSGGQGQFNGGDGILREFEFLKPLDLTFIGQHRVQRPYALAGGEPGQTGQQTLLRKDGTIESLTGVATSQVLPGDRIVIETPGGGGMGKCICRKVR
jgi:5-oxoprolinase (ATP-hydrolysing)